jgi:hypothetical protein
VPALPAFFCCLQETRASKATGAPTRVDRVTAAPSVPRASPTRWLRERPWGTASQDAPREVLCRHRLRKQGALHQIEAELTGGEKVGPARRQALCLRRSPSQPAMASWRGTEAVLESKFMLPWSFSEEAAAEKYMAQLQHNMWVTHLRTSVLSIITGGGKWVEITIPLDPLYLSVLVNLNGQLSSE